MKKILIYLMAAVLITSCDNLKRKEVKEDKESTTKSKTAADEDEEDEAPVKRKKVDVAEEDNDQSVTNEEEDRAINNTGEGWTATQRRNFVKTCASQTGMEQDKAESYCICMQRKIEKIYPDAKDADALSEAKAKELAMQCLDL